MPSTPSSSRQHPHLPPHLASSNDTPSAPAGSSPTPALPIEPSDSRQQAYSYSQNLGGRRGSTDPLLHASMAANASANMAAQHHHHQQQQQQQQQQQSSQQHAGHNSTDSAFNSSAGAGAASASTTIDGSTARKRTAASAMLDQDGPDASNLGQNHHERRPTPPGLSSYNPFGHWQDSFPASAANATAQDPANFFANLPGATSNGDHKHAMNVLGGAAHQIAAAGGQHPGANLVASSSHSFAPHHNAQQGAAAAGGSPSSPDAEDSSSGGIKSAQPYARSPELRVSHKLAERKRRKEMKDLFDDLKNLLPMGSSDGEEKDNSVSGTSKNKDSGKLSKWEVLSKAIEHISSINYTQAALLNEVQSHRAQLGLPPYSLPSFAGPSSNEAEHEGVESK